MSLVQVNGFLQSGGSASPRILREMQSRVANRRYGKSTSTRFPRGSGKTRNGTGHNASSPREDANSRTSTRSGRSSQASNKSVDSRTSSARSNNSRNYVRQADDDEVASVGSSTISSYSSQNVDEEKLRSTLCDLKEEVLADPDPEFIQGVIEEAKAKREAERTRKQKLRNQKRLKKTLAKQQQEQVEKKKMEEQEENQLMKTMGTLVL